MSKTPSNAKGGAVSRTTCLTPCLCGCGLSLISCERKVRHRTMGFSDRRACLTDKTCLQASPTGSVLTTSKSKSENDNRGAQPAILIPTTGYHLGTDDSTNADHDAKFLSSCFRTAQITQSSRKPMLSPRTAKIKHASTPGRDANNGFTSLPCKIVYL